MIILLKTEVFVGRGEVLTRFCHEPRKTQSGWKVEASSLIFQGLLLPLTLLRRVCEGEGATHPVPYPLFFCGDLADLLLRSLQEFEMAQKLIPSKEG